MFYQVSLDLIEKSAFVVALDDEPYEFDQKQPDKLDRYGRILLHGNGHNRWFDKSFTLCVGSNGRVCEYNQIFYNYNLCEIKYL